MMKSASILNSPSPSVISVHATALGDASGVLSVAIPKTACVYPSSTSHSFATITDCVLSDMSVIVKLVCHSYINEEELDAYRPSAYSRYVPGEREEEISSPSPP